MPSLPVAATLLFIRNVARLLGLVDRRQRIVRIPPSAR